MGTGDIGMDWSKSYRKDQISANSSLHPVGIQQKSISNPCADHTELHPAQAGRKPVAVARQSTGKVSSVPETYNSATAYGDKSSAKAARQGRGPFCSWPIHWRQEEREQMSSYSLCPMVTYRLVLFHFKEILIRCSLRGDITHAFTVRTFYN